jgi:Tfp pilus assembly protein PilN
MRNLEASDWFTSANVTSVTAAPKEGEQANTFKMTVHTSVPGDVELPGANSDPAKKGSIKPDAKPQKDKAAGGK